MYQRDPQQRSTYVQNGLSRPCSYLSAAQYDKRDLHLYIIDLQKRPTKYKRDLLLYEKDFKAM